MLILVGELAYFCALAYAWLFLCESLIVRRGILGLDGLFQIIWLSQQTKSSSTHYLKHIIIFHTFPYLLLTNCLRVDSNVASDFIYC